MISISDLSADILIFETPRSGRIIGGVAACMGVITVLAATLIGMNHRLAISLQIAGIALAVIGAIVSLRRERFRLDLRERQFEYFKGFVPFVRSTHGNLSEFNRIGLDVSTQSNLYGEEEVKGAVSLYSTNRKLRLSLVVSEVEANSLVYRISGAAGATVDDRSRLEEPARTKPMLKTIATLSGWAGMLAVIATVAMTASRKAPKQGLGPRDFPSFRNQAMLSDFDRIERLYRQGDYRGAEVALRRAITMQNNYPYAYNMLAYALADQGKLDEAMDAARKALAQDPRNGDIIDTVAEMHQRRREYKPAAEYYEKALRHSLSQGTCQTHAKYGETLVAMGRKEEAVLHLEAAIADRTELNAEWHDRAAVALASLRGQPPPPPARRVRSGIAPGPF